MPMQRYVVNGNFAHIGHYGEVVEADPVLHAVWIEAGYLSPIDDEPDADEA